MELSVLSEHSLHKIDDIKIDILQPAYLQKVINLKYSWEDNEEVIAQILLLLIVFASDSTSTLPV